MLAATDPNPGPHWAVLFWTAVVWVVLLTALLAWSAAKASSRPPPPPMSRLDRILFHGVGGTCVAFLSYVILALPVALVVDPEMLFQDDSTESLPYTTTTTSTGSYVPFLYPPTTSQLPPATTTMGSSYVPSRYSTQGGWDLDCSDFDGPVAVSSGDPHGLDRDGDGIGCE